MSQWDTKTAEWYAKKYGEYATNRLGVDALEIPADSVIVDIGCGTGCALRHTANQVTSGTMIGIDPVPRMVEIAKEQTQQHLAANRIKFLEGSAEDLPFKDQYADFIFAFDSFDHWHNPSQGLKEVQRVLKPKGKWIVIKDGGLPNGTEAHQAFIQALSKANLEVVKEQLIEESEVSFTLWVCQVI